MQISSSSSCGAGCYAASDQDVQVKTLEAKIQDWSTCPTTDAETKKEIVGRLQVQLDSVKSSLDARAKAKESQSSDPSLPSATGLGATVDLLA